MNDEDQWHALKEYEAQSRQSQAARLQHLSETQSRKKKESEYQQSIREQTRRELEQLQAESKCLAEQQANERRLHSEATRDALLTQSAQELRLANQRRREASLAAQQKTKERPQPKGNSMEDTFYEAWCGAYPDIVLIRQHRVFKYRLDFAHILSKVAIELDGGSHLIKENRNKDYPRQQTIEDDGWHFVRFTNEQVKADVGYCVDRVYKIISTRTEEAR